MPSIPILKGTLHYDVDGPEGAPWALILPGAFTAPWQYDPLRDHLKAQFRVITFDYRGIGQSENDLWTVTPTQLCQDVLALLDALEVKKTHVACISLGSFVLAELLHERPSSIDRCVLGSMPALRGSMRFGGDAHEVPRLAKDTQPMKQALETIFPMFVSENFRTNEPERYAEMMRRIGDLGPDQVWAGLQQFYGVFGHDWNRTRVFATLPPDRRLLLAGDGDPFAPLVQIREHPIYRLGPTVVFHGSGHLFFYEIADKYNELVRHFFATGKLPDPLPGQGQLERLAPAEVAR